MAPSHLIHTTKGYTRTIYAKEPKEDDYERINAIVYDFDDLIYLLVKYELKPLFLASSPKIGQPSSFKKLNRVFVV